MPKQEELTHDRTVPAPAPGCNRRAFGRDRVARVTRRATLEGSMKGRGMAGPVVIVGATGAIGGAIARRMTDRNQPLHLIGRDGAKLAALAQTLGATHAVADAMDGAALAAAVKAAGPAIAGLAY